MATIISTRETQFSYFDQLLGKPAWRGRKILDFGGNIGGFLKGASARVDHNDYWCIDLNPVVIDQGRRKFPNAHFVHYNRYSSEFNPQGVRNLPIPDLGLKFDIILAFSVFTHTHQREMHQLVEQLLGLLATGGTLAFTFCDPRYDRSLSDPALCSGTDVRKNLEWQLVRNPSLDIDRMVETASRSNWCVLTDDKLHIEPGIELSDQEHPGPEWDTYCSYFAVEYMGRLFPEASVYPPVRPEWQHCCVLASSDSGLNHEP